MEITYIYLVTNCYGDKNKVYIGKEKSHKKESRKNRHRKKYGDKIEFNYIDQVDSWLRKDWKPLESYWIEQFIQWGFEIQNIRKKGGSGPEFQTENTKLKISKANLGRKISEESKQRMRKPKSKEHRENVSKARLGLKLPDEIRLKMRKPKSNTNNYFRGPRSEENKIKMRHPKLNKLNFKKPKPHLWKEVIQSDKQDKFIKEWTSLSEVKKYFKGDIQACCLGRQKTAGGYKWKYKYERIQA